MKKCSRYLDAIENNIEQDKPAWQDILVHASRCPDCSADMKLRAEIFEVIAELPEPDYPENLHSLIMHEVQINKTRKGDDQENHWSARFFDIFLRPFELVLPAACIVMFVFMLQVDEQTHLSEKTRHIADSRSGITESKSPGMLVQAGGDELEKVTAAEVDVFLRQLAEFRKNHPEATESVKNYRPEIRLVDDRSWSRP